VTTARSWLTITKLSPLPAQRFQQVQHLGLHRRVQRRGRLVQQQQLRLQDQRARNGDALALAARQLVRVAEAKAAAQADLVQRALDARLGVGQAVDGQRLGQDAVDRLPRVQAAVRVLEHHLHLAAKGLAARRGPRRCPPAHRAGRARRQPADGAQHGRLARARFADDAEALARLHGEAGALDGHEAVVRRAGSARRPVDLKADRVSPRPLRAPSAGPASAAGGAPAQLRQAVQQPCV
jgi:hypothetical protein